MTLTSLAVRAGLVAAGAALAAATALAGSASASTSASYIGPGYPDNAHGVWCAQHLMNDYAHALGYSNAEQEDGAFGPLTESWIKWFQGEVGLRADGIVGPATGKALLTHGDQYYGGHHYCFTYLPTPKGW